MEDNLKEPQTHGARCWPNLKLPTMPTCPQPCLCSDTVSNWDSDSFSPDPQDNESLKVNTSLNEHPNQGEHIHHQPLIFLIGCYKLQVPMAWGKHIRRPNNASEVNYRNVC